MITTITIGVIVRRGNDELHETMKGLLGMCENPRRPPDDSKG